MRDRRNELRTLAGRLRGVVFWSAVTGLLTGLVVAGFEHLVLDEALPRGPRAAGLGHRDDAARRVGGRVRVAAGGGPGGEPRDVGRVPAGVPRRGRPRLAGERGQDAGVGGDDRVGGRVGPGGPVAVRRGRGRPRASRTGWGRGWCRSDGRCWWPAPPRAIGAIFKAPATGAVFALESPYQDDLARKMLLPALVGAATGYLMLVAFDGTTPLLTVHGSPPLSGVDLAGRGGPGVPRRGRRPALRRARSGSRSGSRRTAPRCRGSWSAASTLGGLFLAGRALTGRDWRSARLRRGAMGDQRPSRVPGPHRGARLALPGHRGDRRRRRRRRACSSPSSSPARCSGRRSRPWSAGRRACSRSSASPHSSGPGYRVPLAAVMFVAEATGRPGFIVPALLAAVAGELVMGRSSVTEYQVGRTTRHVAQPRSRGSSDRFGQLERLLGRAWRRSRPWRRSLRRGSCPSGTGRGCPRR